MNPPPAAHSDAVCTAIRVMGAPFPFSGARSADGPTIPERPRTVTVVDGKYQPLGASSFDALSCYSVGRNDRQSGRRRRGDEIAHNLDEALRLIELGKVTGLGEDLQATARNLLVRCVGM
jgi:hypothetical protein